MEVLQRKKVKSPKLNKNAEKWVKALESDNYRQCDGTLALKVDGKRVKYCCLGVACAIYQKEVGDLVRTKNRTHGYIDFDGDSNELPLKVAKWLGLQTCSGEFKTILYEGEVVSTLISLNDSFGKSFKEIAKVIRSKPRGLFEKGK